MNQANLVFPMRIGSGARDVTVMMDGDPILSTPSGGWTSRHCTVSRLKYTEDGAFHAGGWVGMSYCSLLGKYYAVAVSLFVKTANCSCVL